MEVPFIFGRADGASIHEAAYICRLLGMTDAINLDGGGSTTLWTDNTGVINHHVTKRQEYVTVVISIV